MDLSLKTIKKYHKGLTLTELLVVVTIILMLVFISIWFFRNQALKGNDAKRKGDVRTIQVAIEEYEKDNNCYPLPDQIVCNPGTGLKPYISKIPCDPITDASYVYDIEDSSCPSWYRIYANLENLNDPDLLASYGPGGTYNYCASSPNAPGCSLTESDFYGCKNGVCVPLFWDAARPGPECDPNYKDPNCFGKCASPVAECKPWNP